MSNKQRISVYPLWMLFLFLCCTGCGSGRSNTDTITKTSDSTSIKTEPSISELKIRYHLDSIRDKVELDSFKRQYNPEQQKIIAAINRIDLSRIGIKCALVVPDTLLTDFSAYAPFPEQLDGADSISQLILINKRIQLFAAYENGKRVQSGPVSTGRKAKPTPNKLYYTNYKAKRKVSTVDGDWIMPWYFNISNNGGIGMHEYTLPGYPASHSCIRMYRENAIWIFNWAQQWVLSEDETSVLKHGTPVLVFSDYDFDQPSPWKQLPQNPDVLQLTENEWTTVKSTISILLAEAQ